MCHIQSVNMTIFQISHFQSLYRFSLSARILHRAPSGPKFSHSENCCGSEKTMSPKLFWDMEGHRGNFRSKNIFWKKKT